MTNSVSIPSINAGAITLDIAKKYQYGRVPENGTNVPTFDFTEGLFRNILTLTDNQQLLFTP